MTLQYTDTSPHFEDMDKVLGNKHNVNVIHKTESDGTSQESLDQHVHQQDTTSDDDESPQNTSDDDDKVHCTDHHSDADNDQDKETEDDYDVPKLAEKYLQVAKANRDGRDEKDPRRRGKQQSPIRP